MEEKKPALCLHCGGTGYADGGEAEEAEGVEEGGEDNREREGAERRRGEFMRALKRGY